MVFKCQKDSFLREFTTKVVKIEKSDDGKCLLSFEDTILFPEGGGQPCDHGVIDYGGETLKVVNVTRKGAEAIHEVSESPANLAEGTEVVQTVDWQRRHDHMQQHSGQHLISALFEKRLNYTTKAWWLGAESSYIDIDGKDITDEEMKRIETLANGFIAQGLPITVDIHENTETVGDAKSRGLPADSGPIRVIKIGDIDANMCCGTHLSNTAQLQVIKLMNIEKTKGKTLVHFLVGDRVISKLESSFQRELQFNLLLKGGIDSHVELLKKLQTSLKSSQKTVQKLSDEIAVKCAEELNANQNGERKFFSLHRKDGVSIDFANTFLRTAKVDKDFFLFITIADGIDSKTGSLVMQGDPKDIAALADPVCKVLGGKGNGKNNRYQAKVTQLNKIKECETLIEEHFRVKSQ